MDWIKPSSISEECSEEDSKQVFDNFDALIWGLVEEVQKDRTILSVMKQAFKSNKPAHPTDLGFKYRICTFKTNQSIEFVSAIVGDPQNYIDRMSRLGYNGIMIKHDAIPARASKKMLKSMLSNYGYDEKVIRSVLKQV